MEPLLVVVLPPLVVTRDCSERKACFRERIGDVSPCADARRPPPRGSTSRVLAYRFSLSDSLRRLRGS